MKRPPLIGDLILVHLLTHDEPQDRTVPAMVKAFQRSETAIRNNLAVMDSRYGNAWVRPTFDQRGPAVWTLTDHGVEVARARRARVLKEMAQVVTTS